MTEEKRILLKAIGLLLDYPDEHFGELLHSMQEALGPLSPSPARDRLLEGIRGLANMDPIALCEEYTRLFDFNPAASLELTYHKWGDARERGAALAVLRRLYAEAGCETAVRELPDYLPLVLEFLSVAPEDSCRRLLDEYRHELNTLAARVAACSSVYGAILQVLAQLALD